MNFYEREKKKVAEKNESSVLGGQQIAFLPLINELQSETFSSINYEKENYCVKKPFSWVVELAREICETTRIIKGND